MALARVSATVPDWSRETPKGFWDSGSKLIRAIRRYQSAKSRAERLWWRQVHRLWSIIAQADIPLETQIGGGLSLPHPNGVVIHPAAVIGPNCLIFQQVTIGMAAGDSVPVIGGHVDIGAGAKIIGPVHVGDHALIGANAVVTRDVPADCVARGNPARVFPRKPELGAP